MHRQQFCLIADRESRVTVKAIALCASHSCGTGGSTLGRVLNACFNDCAKHSWLCTVSSSVRFLIADRTSRVTIKAIALRASHSGGTGGHIIGMVLNVSFALTFLVVHRQQFCQILDC